VYDTPAFYLVDSPIDRCSDAHRTPGLVAAVDGSMSLLMQTESPGAGLEANGRPGENRWQGWGRGVGPHVVGGIESHPP